MPRRCQRRWLLLLFVACDRPAPPVDADSVALASVPPRLARELAVSAVLSRDALHDTARVRCERLDGDTLPERRWRVRATLVDSARTVLFVRADRATGALHRVEVVRRDGPVQRGLILDGASGSVRTVDWSAGLGRPPESATLPRATPAAGALRRLARQLLALPCGESRARRGT